MNLPDNRSAQGRASLHLFQKMLALPWLIAAVLLLVAIGIFVRVPHRTKITESHITLQGGKKMDVRFTLQSPWGWTLPDRIVKMVIAVAGHNVDVEKTAYFGLEPIDPTKPPIITERGGFPDIAVSGQPGSSLKEVHWHFLNFTFFERRLVRAGRDEFASFSIIPPPPAVYPSPVPQTSGSVISPSNAFQIKPLPQEAKKR